MKKTFPYENGPHFSGDMLVFAGVRLQGRAVSFREDNQTFDHLKTREISVQQDTRWGPLTIVIHGPGVYFIPIIYKGEISYFTPVSHL